ncbi:MAG: hypothetical protein Rubg2KO_34350 [Rubricoccaceae bacterium]
MSIVTLEEHTLLSRPLGPESVVLDLGANAGTFSAAMVQRFGCICHAVEPSPAIAAQIPNHPRIHVHPHAMSGQQGEATFHISTDPLSSGFVQAEDIEYTEAITVSVETLPGLLARLSLDRVDVLKADIEGAEIDMFAACSDDELLQVDQYTVEFHDFNGVTPEAEVLRTLDRFRNLGYSVYRKARFAHYDVLIAHTERLGVSPAEWLWIRTGRHLLAGLGRQLTKRLKRS